MILLLLRICLMIICFLCIPNITLLSQVSKTINIFHSPENRLKFGKYLFCQKDYLRAIDEFEFYLGSNSNDTVRFAIGISQLNLGNFSAAHSIFSKLSTNASLSKLSRSWYVKTKFIENDLDYFKKINENYKFNNIKEIQKLYTLSLIQNRYRLESIKELKDFQGEEKIIVSELLSRAMDPEYKNPLTAGILSTLIPGLGKIYTENYGDGITSFLVTGLFAYIAYENFNAKHYTRGWIFAGLATTFYVGNIYGSVVSANVYNVQVQLNLDSDIKYFLRKNDYFLPIPSFLCDN